MERIGGIIVEGADQSGKSHVCNELSALLGFSIHHFSRPGPDTDFKMEYIRPVYHTIFPLIFDRSYLSEMVYGEIFRGYSGVSPEIKKTTESFLNERKYVMVYLKRENYKWEERPEMYTEEDNVLVIDKYEKMFPTVDIPKMKIDSFEPDAVSKIIAFYQQHNPTYVR